MGTKLIPPAAKHKPKWARYVSGQRLGLLAILLLMLSFSISSYVGSAKNHALLAKASHDRSVLIVSTGQLTDLTTQELVYIQQLITVVDQQNAALKKAGQQIIVVPPKPQKPYVLTTKPGSSASPTKTTIPSVTPTP